MTGCKFWSRTCSDAQTSGRLRTNIVLAPLTIPENIAPSVLTVGILRAFGDCGMAWWPG
jgi:hypothetical protein